MQQIPSLSLSGLDNLSLSPGHGEIISFEARNSGGQFLNRCHLEQDSAIAGWISNRQSESLAPGQRVEYFLTVNAPLDARPGTYNSRISVVCDELRTSIPLSVSIVTGAFTLAILSSERVGTRLRITYSLEDFSGTEATYALTYELSKTGLIFASGNGSVFVKALHKETHTLEFELPKGSEGTFDLVLKAGKDGTIREARSMVFAPQITGFAISDQNGRALTWIGAVALIGVVLFFIVRFVRKRHYVRVESPAGRQFIKIDVG